MNTPAETLVLVEAGTIGGTLSQVDSQSLVHTLAERMLEVEADTLGDTLGDVHIKPLLNTLNSPRH